MYQKQKCLLYIFCLIFGYDNLLASNCTHFNKDYDVINMSSILIQINDEKYLSYEEAAIFTATGLLCGCELIALNEGKAYANISVFKIEGYEEPLVIKLWSEDKDEIQVPDEALSPNFVIDPNIQSCQFPLSAPPDLEMCGLHIDDNTPKNPKYTNTIDDLTWTIIPQIDGNNLYVITAPTTDTYTQNEAEEGSPYALNVDNHTIVSIIDVGTTFSWEVDNVKESLMYTICIDNTECYFEQTNKFSQPQFTEKGAKHQWQVSTYDPDTKIAVTGPTWYFYSYNTRPPKAISTSFTITEDNSFSEKLNHTNETLVHFFEPADYNVTYEKNELIEYHIDSPPENGQIDLNPSGNFTYTPNENYFGTDQFRYYVRDERNDMNSDPESILLSITAVCDNVINKEKPSISGIFKVGQTLNASVGEWDTIEEPKNFNTFIQWMNGNNEILAQDVDKYKLPYTMAHKCIQIAVTSENICGESASEKSETCVTIENTPPYIQVIENLTIMESSDPFSFTLLAIDIDHDPLTWSVQNIVYDHSSQTSVSVIPTQTNPTSLSLIKADDYFGDIQFEVTVEDSFGGKDLISMSITVRNVNDRPDFTVDNIDEIDEDTSGVITINNIHRGGNIDIEYESLTFEISGNDLIPEMNNPIDAFLKTASCKFTTTEHFFGQILVEIKVTDEGEGSLTKTHTLIITVDPVNDAPLNKKLPSFSGEMYVGKALTASPGIWDDSIDEPYEFTELYDYQWQRSHYSENNFIDIAGATERTYTLTADDAHHEIRVIVTAKDNGGGFFQEMLPVEAKSGYTRVENSFPLLFDNHVVNNSSFTCSNENKFNIIWMNSTLNHKSIEEPYEIQIYNPKGEVCSYPSPIFNTNGGYLSLCVDNIAHGDLLTFKYLDKTENSLITLTSGMFYPEKISDYHKPFTLDRLPYPLNKLPMWHSDFFYGDELGCSFHVRSESEIYTVTTIMDEDSTPNSWHLPPHLTIQDNDQDIFHWEMTSPSHGYTTIVEYSYTPVIQYTPYSNYFGTDIMTLTVSDGYGGTDQINILTYVYPRNDAPVLEVNPPIEGTPHVGQTLTYTGVTWRDTLDYLPEYGYPNGKVFSYSKEKCNYIWLRSDSAYGNNAITITENASTETYTLTIADNNRYIQAKLTCTDDEFSPGVKLSPAINITASSKWIKIDNQPPIIEGEVSNLTVYEDQSIDNLQLSELSAYDTDNDSIHWEIASLPKHGSCEIQQKSAVISDSPFKTYEGPTITYVPDKDYYGQDTFSIHAKDFLGKDFLGLTSTVKMISIDISPVNDPPRNITLPTLSASDIFHVGHMLTLNVGVWDDYTDCQHGNACSSPDDFTYTYQYFVSEDEFCKNAEKLATTQNYLLTKNENNKFIFVEVSAFDNCMATLVKSDCYPITNNPPQITPTTLHCQLSEDEDPVPWQMPEITVVDPDGDPLTWTIHSHAQPNSATVIADNNQIIYTPKKDCNGNDSFQIEISDGLGGLCAASMNIFVTPVDDPPYVNVKNAIEPKLYTDNQSFEPIDLSQVFSDIDNEDKDIVPSVLTIKPILTKTEFCNNIWEAISLENDTLYVENKILYLIFDNNRRCLNLGESSQAVITIAGQSGALSDTHDFTVTVKGTDDPPEITPQAIESITADEDESMQPVSLTSFFTDIDNSDEGITKTVSCSNPELLACSVSGNSLSISLKANEYGTSNIDIVGHSNGLTVNHSVSFQVNSVCDPITLSKLATDIIYDENIKDEYTKTTLIPLEFMFTDVDFQKTNQTDAEDITKTTRLISLSSNAFAFTPTIIEKNTLKIEIKRLFHINTQDKVVAEIEVTGTSVGDTGASEGTNCISSISDAFYITINGLDEPPYVSSPIKDITTVTEKNPPSYIDLSTTFSDTDNNDAQITKTCSSIDDPNGIIDFIQIDSRNLTVAYNSCDYLNVGDTENATITVIGHSNSLTARDSFSVTITGEDTKPVVANAMKDLTISIGKSCPEDLDINLINDYQIIEDPDRICLITDVSNVFTDVDNEDSEITKIFGSTNAYGQLTSVCDNEQCTICIQCIDDDQTKIITYHTNLEGISNEKSEKSYFNININPDKPPYVANPIQPITVNEDAPYTVIDISNTFTDDDNDDNKITKAIIATSNSIILTSLENNHLTITFKSGKNGQSIITLEATSNGQKVTHDVQITVNPINNAPNPPESVEITGVFHVGEKVHVINKGDWNDDTDYPTPGNITLTYMFYRSDNNSRPITPSMLDTPIQSGSDASYQLTIEDNKKYIAACVIGTDDGYGEPEHQSVTVCTSNWKCITNTQPCEYTSWNLSVLEDHILTWDLPQDIDPDGDPVHIIQSTNATHGTVSVDSQKTQIHFEPRKNWNGSDSFQIEISDGLGGLCAASMNIFVTPVDDPPYIFQHIDDKTVCEDSDQINMNLVSVFSDIDNDDNLMTYTITSFSDQLITAEIIEKNLNISFINNQNGEASVHVLCNSNGLTVAEDFLITIKPVNDPPNPPDYVSISGIFHVGQTITVNKGDWSHNIDAPEDLDFIYEFYRADTPEEAYRTLITSSEEPTYTLQPEDNWKWIQAKVIGEDNGVDCEGNPNPMKNSVKSEWFQITNTAPIIETAMPISVTMDEDGSPSGWIAPSIVYKDADMDSVTWSLYRAPDHGEAIVSGVDMDYHIEYTPEANWNSDKEKIPDSFVIMIADSFGGACTATIQVFVIAQNDPPRKGSLYFSGDNHPGETLIVYDSGWADDIDLVESGLELSYQWKIATDKFCSEAEKISGAITNTYEVQEEDYNKFIIVEVTFTDHGEGQGSQSITGTTSCLNIGNEMPKISPRAYNLENVYEDSRLYPKVIEEISVEDEDEDSIQWSIATEPKYGSAICFGTDKNPVIGYTPNSNLFGQDSFWIMATDEFGGTDSIPITINIVSVNDPPSIGSIVYNYKNILDQENKTIQIKEDAPTVRLTIENISGGPANENQDYNVIIHSSQQQIISSRSFEIIQHDKKAYLDFSPEKDEFTEDIPVQLTVIIKDNEGTANGGMDSCTESFWIEVLPENDKPSFDSIHHQLSEKQASGDHLWENFIYNISSGADNENDPLSFHITKTDPNKVLQGVPSVEIVDTVNGNLSFTPSNQSYGEAVFEIKLFDGMAFSDPMSFTIEIEKQMVYIPTIIPMESELYEFGRELSIEASNAIEINAARGQCPYYFFDNPDLASAGLSLSKNECNEQSACYGFPECKDWFITGTFSFSGEKEFRIDVNDVHGNHAYKNYTIKIDNAFKFETRSIPSQIKHGIFSIEIKATGGKKGYYYDEDETVRSSLPEHFSIEKNSQIFKISGVPQESDSSYSFILKARDSLNRTITQEYMLILVDSLKINTVRLDDAIVGQQYEYCMSATGGNDIQSEYIWSTISDNLPKNLSFHQTGCFSGEPSKAGDCTINFMVKDTDGNFDTKQLNLVISDPLKFKTLSLPSGVAYSSYHADINVVGGRQKYSYSLYNLINLEDHEITIDKETGEIYSEFLPSARNAEFTVKVTDSSTPTQTKKMAFPLLINSEGCIKTKNLPKWRQDIPSPENYSDFTISRCYCDSEVEWTATGLPDGVTISSQNGRLTGISKEFGEFQIEIFLKCNDSIASSGSIYWTIEKALEIETPLIEYAEINKPYSFTFMSSENSVEWKTDPQNAFAVYDLFLSKNGHLSGIPTETASTEITVCLSDSIIEQDYQEPVCKEYLFMIITTELDFEPASLPPAKVGKEYNEIITVDQGIKPYTWNDNYLEKAVNIPGLFISSTSHSDQKQITGTATSHGDYYFTVDVYDKSGWARGKKNYGIHVYEALKLSPTELVPGEPGENYSDSLTLEKSGIPPYTFTALDPLPKGLTLNSKTGKITGTVHEDAVSMNFAVKVEDSIIPTLDKEEFSIRILTGELEIITQSLRAGLKHWNYIMNLEGQGGTHPYTWSLDQDTPLPMGLALTQINNEGRITGIPLSYGEYKLRVRLTDAFNYVATREYLLDIRHTQLSYIHFLEAPELYQQSIVFIGDVFKTYHKDANYGDEIAVFDENNTIRGRSIVMDTGKYAIEVFGNETDSHTPMTFKVWDKSEEKELILSNNMFAPDNVFDGAFQKSPYVPPEWTKENDQWGLNIHAEDFQKIPLNPGWNLFSFSINKVYHESVNLPPIAILSNTEYEKVNSLKEVLQSIDGKYETIRNFDQNGSLTYNPGLPSHVNTLYYLSVGYGYWIKMTEKGYLTLYGKRAQPSDILTLNTGWNLIGCWHTDLQYDSATPPDIEIPNDVQKIQINSLKEVFLSIDGKYSSVRNYDANGSTTFDPRVPSFVNDLHYIGPGYGYWIKINESSNFSY